MVNLQKGFFRLTVVVSVFIGLLFFLLNFEDSQRNVETFFQRDSYENWKKAMKRVIFIMKMRLLVRCLPMSHILTTLRIIFEV